MKFQGKWVTNPHTKAQELSIPAIVESVIDNKVYQLNNAKKTPFIRGIVRFVNRNGEEQVASGILFEALQEAAEFTKGSSVNLRVVPNGEEAPLLVISGAAVEKAAASDFFTQEELAAQTKNAGSATVDA